MKILLGMSGGIDSTYAALKLKEAGNEVEGAVLVMHSYTETEAAKLAAESVGIPLHIIDCSNRFDEIVVRNFTQEYTRGRTPNPCVICNSEIKFKYMLEYALENGFDKIATGHYAEPVCMDGRYSVRRPLDSKKDQTYMLWRLDQNVLSRLLLPLCNEEKNTIREITKKTGLFAADRPDSQEICFIPDGDYASYIEERVGKSTKGLFVDPLGNVLGEHKGIIHYTIGQRKGLGIALGKRIFVTDIDVERNRITLSDNDEKRSCFALSGMNFSGMSEPETGTRTNLCVKVRYQAPLVKCTLEYLGAGCGKVYLDEPQRALTPGQCAVFYLKDILAAGGYID